MKKILNFRFFIFLILISVNITSIFPMGMKEIVMAPMKPKKLVILDGEYLRYSEYKSGEKVTDFYLVTRVSPDKKKLYLYREGIDINSNYKLPDNYTNFHRKFLINLEDASLVFHKNDYTDRFISNNFKGRIEDEFFVDKTKGYANYKEQIWDGNEFKTMTSRIKIKPNFPVQDVESLGFIGGRLFDLNQNGIVYLVTVVIKEPVPFYFEIKGREVIKTKAGVFNTIKVGGVVADPFLGKLMESYSKKSFFWIEDSPRGLVVKTQDASDTVNILEEVSSLAADKISQWKEK